MTVAWAAVSMGSGEVHIVPLEDDVAHELDPECVCGPHTEYVHPDTGDYHDHPMHSHHALDGRP